MLRIGKLEFELPVVQAALSGYSDLAMRRVARLHGAVYTLNEVVLDSLVLTRGRKQRFIAQVSPEDHPVGGQLMGADPETFARAADALVEAGYDCVDINFGCPVRKVLGRCRGGYLLSQPRIALEIVRRVHAAVGGRRPVTVKMRRGMDDSATSEHSFFSILDGVFEIGADAVTIHPRTVRQRYIGPSHWPFLARVKKHVGDRVVLGSGDLFDAADCVRMMAETGVDGVTAARGCIGNPWLFREARALLAGQPLPDPPSVPEQGDTIRRHFEWTVEIYGSQRAGAIMRKFGIKYSELHPMGRAVRDAFIQAGSTAEWLAVLEQWYAPGKDWPPGVRRAGPGHLVAAGASLGE
jgi:nifR3 family TIM-barrel protein